MDFLGEIKEMFSYCFSKVNVRLIKLLISLWMIADVILDGFTTKKYLDYALESTIKLRHMTMRFIFLQGF